MQQARRALDIKQIITAVEQELKAYQRAKNNYYIPVIREMYNEIKKMRTVQEVITYLESFKDEKEGYDIIANELLNIICMDYLYDILPEGAPLYYLTLGSGHGVCYLLYAPKWNKDRNGNNIMEMINITADIARAADFKQIKFSVSKTVGEHGLYQEHYPLYCGNVVGDDIDNALSELSRRMYNKDKAFHYVKLSTNVR